MEPKTSLPTVKIATIIAFLKFCKQEEWRMDFIIDQLELFNGSVRDDQMHDGLLILSDDIGQ